MVDQAGHHPRFRRTEVAEKAPRNLQGNKQNNLPARKVVPEDFLLLPGARLRRSFWDGKIFDENGSCGDIHKNARIRLGRNCRRIQLRLELLEYLLDIACGGPVMGENQPIKLTVDFLE
jgi:hypothetical protein